MGASKAPSGEGVAGGGEGGCDCDGWGDEEGEEEKRGIFLFVKMGMVIGGVDGGWMLWEESS